MDFGRTYPLLRFVFEKFLKVIVEGLVGCYFLYHLVVELKIFN